MGEYKYMNGTAPARCGRLTIRCRQSYPCHTTNGISLHLVQGLNGYDSCVGGTRMCAGARRPRLIRLTSEPGKSLAQEAFEMG